MKTAELARSRTWLRGGRSKNKSMLRWALFCRNYPREGTLSAYGRKALHGKPKDEHDRISMIASRREGLAGHRWAYRDVIAKLDTSPRSS